MKLVKNQKNGEKSIEINKTDEKINKIDEKSIKVNKINEIDKVRYKKWTIQNAV